MLCVCVFVCVFVCMCVSVHHQYIASQKVTAYPGKLYLFRFDISKGISIYSQKKTMLAILLYDIHKKFPTEQDAQH